MDPRFLQTTTSRSPLESSLCIPPSQTVRFETSSKQSPPPLLDLTITDYEKVKDGRDSYYRYHIRVNQGKKSLHRYSEFQWLRDQLCLKFPGCAMPLLPPKEGVSSYIYSQESTFYDLRKHGLEFFLQFLSRHPRLSTSEDFTSFLEDDELNFGLKVRDSTQKTSVFSVIRDVGSSVAATVTWYIYGDSSADRIASAEVESSIEAGVRGLREELQDLERLSATIVIPTKVEQTTQFQGSIVATAELSKAYEGMSGCDGQALSAGYEIHADAHRKVGAALKEAERMFRELEEIEVQDYRRAVMGAIEAHSRLQQLSSRIADERQLLQTAERERAQKRIETMETDLQEAANDLKRDIDDLQPVLKMLRDKVAKAYTAAMVRLSEDMQRVWTEVQERLPSESAS